MTGLELIALLAGVSTAGILARNKIKALHKRIDYRDKQIRCLKAKIRKIKEDK